MKKTLVFIIAILLVLSLLSACGGKGSKGSSNNQESTTAAESSDSDSESASSDKISSTALLSIDDAEEVLGLKMFEANFAYNKIDEKEPSYIQDVSGIKSVYNTDGYFVSISFYQDQESYVKYRTEKIEKEIKNPSENEIQHYSAHDGVGDKSYLSYIDGGISSIIDIFYGNHYISVSVTSTTSTMSEGLPEETVSWMQDKAIQCGKLALKHLEEILAGTRSPERNVRVSDSEATIDEGLNMASSETIMPSMLINADEAGSIINASMVCEEGYEDLYDIGYATNITSIFISDAYYFVIIIYQDSVFQEIGEGIAKFGGMPHFMKERVDSFDALERNSSDIMKLDGLGDGAYYYKREGVWVLDFYQDGYWFTIGYQSTGNVTKTRDKDEEFTWKKEKTIEAGKLVSGRLKDLIN